MFESDFNDECVVVEESQPFTLPMNPFVFSKSLDVKGFFQKCHGVTFFKTNPFHSMNVNHPTMDVADFCIFKFTPFFRTHLSQ